MAKARSSSLSSLPGFLASKARSSSSLFDPCSSFYFEQPSLHYAVVRPAQMSAVSWANVPRSNSDGPLLSFVLATRKCLEANGKVCIIALLTTCECLCFCRSTGLVSLNSLFLLLRFKLCVLAYMVTSETWPRQPVYSFTPVACSIHLKASAPSSNHARETRSDWEHSWISTGPPYSPVEASDTRRNTIYRCQVTFWRGFLCDEDLLWWPFQRPAFC